MALSFQSRTFMVAENYSQIDHIENELTKKLESRWLNSCEWLDKHWQPLVYFQSHLGHGSWRSLNERGTFFRYSKELIRIWSNIYHVWHIKSQLKNSWCHFHKFGGLLANMRPFRYVASYMSNGAHICICAPFDIWWAICR